MARQGWRRLSVSMSAVRLLGVTWQLVALRPGTLAEAFVYGWLWLVGLPAVAYLRGR